MERFFTAMIFSGLVCVLFLFAGCGENEISFPDRIGKCDEKKAMQYAEKSVSFGDRYSGSESIKKYGDWIIEKLKTFPGVQVEVEEFECDTPSGNLPFRNILAKIPGKSTDYVIAGAHYDTKKFSSFSFAGANDGASGVAALLLIGEKIAEMQEKLPYTLHLVFFDGEECQEEYSENDGLHGSKYHAAGLYKRKGRCRAMILLDMIGDKDLLITPPANSHAGLVSLFEKAAASLGGGTYAGRYKGAVLDDHVPFLEKKIPAIDLIDFSYGENNVYWHTPEDTLSRISGKSIAFASDVTIRMLYNLKNTGL